MEQYYKIVFEALEKSSGIEKAVSEISAGLQVPVAVLDPYGRLLADAYTSFFPALDTDGGQKEILWIHMIEDYHTRVYDRECESSSVVEESEEGITVLNAVLFKGSLQGFCITFHFGKETCPLNRLICRALAVGYGRRDFVSNLKGFGLKQLISRVLLGRGREQERFPEIGEEIYEACAPAPFMMAVIEPDKKSDLNIWRIYQEISSHFPELLFYRDAGEIAVLFVSVDSEKKSNDINRGRIYKAGDIAKPAAGRRDFASAVTFETTVEDVMSVLSEYPCAGVTGQTGELVGYIDRESAMKIFSRFSR